MRIPLFNQPLHSGLYLVPTPIGNLADITLRALHVLSQVAWIAAEDTRITRKLLHHYDIHTPMIACHEHNTLHVVPRLISLLKEGQSVALVSDAGTPLVSDPGFECVQACLDGGISVFPLPGASAVLTALIGSGLPQHAFTFGGFVPVRSGARRAFLKSFCDLPHTLIFFETTRRLSETLKDCLESFGDRDVVIARELTKHFETFHRGQLQTCVDDPALKALKGEIVLMIRGASLHPLAQDEHILDALKQALQECSLSEAVRRVHQKMGGSRHVLYRQALDLREQ